MNCNFVFISFFEIYSVLGCHTSCMSATHDSGQTTGPIFKGQAGQWW